MNLSLFSKPSSAIPLAIFAVLAALPFVAIALDQSFYVAFFARILVYAIAASALNLALGYGGLVSFGHSLFLGIGGYAVGLLSFHEIDSGWIHLGMCLALCAITGVITGAISLRTTGIAFIMITLAFAQMGYFLFVSLKNYGGDDGLAIPNASRFGTFTLASAVNVYAVAFVVLILVTWWLAKLRQSPFGMTLRGAQQNARRVAAIGLPAFPYQLTAYVISGMISGIAGLLLANLNAFASPSMLAWSVSGELIVMVVLGGMGSVFGPLLGALVFLGLEEILKAFTENWMAIFGPLIVLMSLLGKKGIAGFLETLDLRVRRNSMPPGKEGEQ